MFKEDITKLIDKESSDKHHGILVAATIKGSQDNWVEQNASQYPYDAHAKLLHPRGKYQVGYSKIYTRDTIHKKCTTQGKQRVCLVVEKQCDLINEIDLVLSGESIHEHIKHDTVNLNDVICCIEVIVGGSRFDAFHAEDIDTQIRTNCDIWKKNVTIINSTLFIPLTLAPFHKNNLISPIAYHNIEICVTFAQGLTTLPDCELYGNVYYVHSQKHRHTLFHEPHNYITMQNQYCGVEQLTASPETNINTFKLYFNHPVSILFFWGMDIDRIRRVALYLQESQFYNGPVEPLLYKQRQHNISTNVVAMFFSNDEISSSTQYSSINFSRMDSATLTIETDEKDSHVHIVGINMQPVRYMQGMFALAYSK